VMVYGCFDGGGSGSEYWPYDETCMDLDLVSDVQYVDSCLSR
jgi:hypothetical protein